MPRQVNNTKNILEFFGVESKKEIIVEDNKLTSYKLTNECQYCFGNKSSVLLYRPNIGYVSDILEPSEYSLLIDGDKWRLEPIIKK